jgi:hypothetical protein
LDTESRRQSYELGINVEKVSDALRIDKFNFSSAAIVEAF